jgi:hypothetical protein
MSTAYHNVKSTMAFPRQVSIFLSQFPGIPGISTWSQKPKKEKIQWERGNV